MDCLLENIRKAETVVCLLGCSRRGPEEHGTPIRISEKVSAVSYFEAELFMAALCGKPIELFVAEGFNPGPRLASLLHMLEFALPQDYWRIRQNEKDILNGI